MPRRTEHEFEDVVKKGQGKSILNQLVCMPVDEVKNVSQDYSKCMAVVCAYLPGNNIKSSCLELKLCR